MTESLSLDQRNQASLVNDEPPPQDMDMGTDAWLAVAASWAIHFVVLGIPSSFGVFQEYYVNNLNSYRGTHSTFAVSMIGSVVNCSLGLLGIPAGRLTDIYGNRKIAAIGGVLVGLSLILASVSHEYWQLLIAQGVLFGLSCPIAYYPALTIISHYFHSRLGIATGIAVSGSGIGGLMLAPFMRFLLSEFGSSKALLIIAIFGALIVLMSSWFLKPRIHLERREFSYLTVLQDSNFARLFAIAVFSSLGYFVPFFYSAPFAVYHGMTAFQGSIVVGLINGLSGLGRIILGFFSDKIGHLNMLLVCQVTASLSILLIWPFAISFGSLIVFGIIYGFFIGGHISLFPLVIVDIFGSRDIASVTGMVYTGFFFGNLIGPPMCGFMIDKFTIVDQISQVTQINFLPSILFGGLSILISAFILLDCKIRVSNGVFWIKI